MTAVPDMPTAHLWRYDCAERPAASRRATETVRTQKKSIHGNTVANVATDTVTEPPATAADSPLSEASEATVAAPAGTAAPPEAEKTPSSAGADASTGTTAPPPAPAPLPAPAPAPATNADVAAAPAIPADLVMVRAADPSAADRIAAYCNKVTASASDQAAVAAGCRHEEVAAWTRLVLNNEYPTLDEVTRRKCSESPFPDSYVAKESCAKYVLHVNR